MTFREVQANMICCLRLTDEKTMVRRDGKGRTGSGKKKEEKESLPVGGNDFPAKEFPLPKALYISLCKPYHALRMS